MKRSDKTDTYQSEDSEISAQTLNSLCKHNKNPFYSVFTSFQLKKKKQMKK